MANLFGVNEVINKILHDNESKAVDFIFKILEEKTGVSRKYILYGIIGFVAFWLIMGYAGQFVTNLIGTIYPAYSSIHAIESKGTQDDTKWLTYWIVYSVFSFVEYFTSIILGWFPLYWLAKCILLLWLMLPIELNGSMILYYNVIKPYFFKCEHLVENVAGIQLSEEVENKSEEDKVEANKEEAKPEEEKKKE